MTVQWNDLTEKDPYPVDEGLPDTFFTSLVQNLMYLYATQQVEDGSEVTISSGTATLVSNMGRVTVDTESDASEDYLDSFGGLGEGQMAFVFPASASRTVILRDGVGNIDTQGFGDEIALRESNQFVWVQRFGSTYLIVATNVPPRYYVQFTILNHDSALSTGDDQFVWQVHPELDGYSIVECYFMVHGESSSGLPQFQVYHERHSQDIFSTAPTIDVSEKSSRTAATPAVLNSSYVDLQADDELRHDVDGAGTGATGLSVMYVLEKL